MLISVKNMSTLEKNVNTLIKKYMNKIIKRRKNKINTFMGYIFINNY